MFTQPAFIITDPARGAYLGLAAGAYTPTLWSKLAPAGRNRATAFRSLEEATSQLARWAEQGGDVASTHIALASACRDEYGHYTAPQWACKGAGVDEWTPGEWKSTLMRRRVTIEMVIDSQGLSEEDVDVALESMSEADFSVSAGDIQSVTVEVEPIEWADIDAEEIEAPGMSG